MSEQAGGGKKLLKDLAAKVREKTDNSGEQLLDLRALKQIDELAKELTGPDAMPGLKLWRDTTAKFRLQRERKNAEIAIEWQRNIGAIVMTGMSMGKMSFTHRYLSPDEAAGWRRMDGLGELYEDLSKALTDLLYPEAR
jgi:hypothetical protein